MSIDIFDWRTMTAAVLKIVPPPSIFTDRIFKKQPARASKNIDYDLLTGGKGVAGFVRDADEALMVVTKTRTGYSIPAPRIREKELVPADVVLLTRGVGMPMYSGPEGPSAHVKAEVGRILGLLRDRIERRLQLMCAQALTGVIEYSAAHYAFTITFPIPAANLDDATFNWDTAAGGSDPINEDLRRWKTLVGQSGYPADTLLLSPTAATAFLQNINVQALLDLRNVSGLKLNLEGANYLGNFVGLETYEVPDQYTNDAGVATNFLTDNYVIVGASSAPYVVEFGGITDLKAATNIALPLFSKTYEKEDPSELYILVESRPLPIPKSLDAHVYAQVLGLT